MTTAPVAAPGDHSELQAVLSSYLPIANALAIARLLNAIGASHQAAQVSGSIGHPTSANLVAHGIGSNTNHTA